MSVKYSDEIIGEMIEALSDVAVSTNCMDNTKDHYLIDGCVIEEVKKVLSKLRELHK